MNYITIAGKKYPYFVSANLSQTYLSESKRLQDEKVPLYDPLYVGLTLSLFSQAIKSGYQLKGLWFRLWSFFLVPKIQFMARFVSGEDLIEMTALLMSMTKEELMSNQKKKLITKPSKQRLKTAKK